MKTRLLSVVTPAILLVLVALAGLFVVVGVIEIVDAEAARGTLDVLRGAVSALFAGVIWLSGRTSRLSRSLLIEAQIDRAAAEAARQRILMPVISLNDQMQISEIAFPKTTIEAGATAHYAIPRIRGLPLMRLRIGKDGRETAAEVEVNWDTGQIRILGGEEEMKDLSIEVAGDYLSDQTEAIIPEGERGLGYVVRDIYVYLAVHEDGDEGVVAMRTGTGWLPLVAADPIRLAQLRPIAEATARTMGKPVRLVRFTTREEVETINP